jgi:hypothetical protein
MENNDSIMLDDGTVEICNLTNTAEDGDMPAYKLEPITTQYYGEKSIGITRQYLAKGANEQVDMLIEIWNDGIVPKISQYAIIIESNEQFRIDNVQPTYNKDGLKVIDLTLSRLEKNYDCAE